MAILSGSYKLHNLQAVPQLLRSLSKPTSRQPLLLPSQTARLHSQRRQLTTAMASGGNEKNTEAVDFGQGDDGPSPQEKQRVEKERQQQRQEKEQQDLNENDPRVTEAGKEYPFAKQTQENPGHEWKMDPAPDYGADDYVGNNRLKDKVALITGGDSGIGRSVAFMYAREGADVAIAYLNEDRDAEETKRIVEAEGRKAILIPGDLESEEQCLEVVRRTVDEFGRIDILVNNAAFQGTGIKDISELDRKRVERTFAVNIIAPFTITKAAVEHMPPGSVVINVSSVAGYKGSPKILDYAATKGAINQFTKGLAQMLMPKRGIRAVGVAPGPIWTPIQPSSFDAESVAELGKGSPEQRAGQPKEVATAFVFLASKDASYVNGEVLAVTGGDPSAD